MTEQGEAKLAEYCRGANRWSSERRAKPRLELCRVATEEDKVKEEDEVSLFGLCRAYETKDEIQPYVLGSHRIRQNAVTDGTKTVFLHALSGVYGRKSLSLRCQWQ